jgi:small-conductance mechanosensitive channel
MTPGTLELLALGGLVLAAGGAHWHLRRLGRRLAHRAAGPPRSGRRRAVGSRAALGLLALELLLWIGVAWILSQRLPQLQMSREAALDLVSRSVTAPLFTLNGRAYSALNLITLPALLAALWIAVSAVVGLGKRQLARLAGGPKGVHESVAVLARIVLAFVGAIVICQAWGVDMSSLTFLGSVLGVGIGFGLQNIANNFVSGILIGLERPVEPGDFVRVGEFSGTVKRIGGRSTEIETLDRVTILVPNARFLELEVINWTHGDPVSQLHVPVGVAYGSDVARVRAALLEAARAHPQVLADPRPEVRLLSFGESSLDFELLVWMDEPRRQLHLKSDLNFLIAETLQRYGVSVPFPQRDLHVRSPEILEAIRAWTARSFSDEERALARAPQQELAAAVPILAGPPDPPAVWTDAALAAVASRMRGPGGIEIRDRRHLLRTHRLCFVGEEAVDWLIDAQGLTRKEAVALGQLLLERELAHHVLDEHDFRDGNFYYRFRADDACSEAGDAQESAASKSATPTAA